MKTFELEITATVNGKPSITDYVYYNYKGEITGWSVWSGHIKDYIPVDLKQAQDMWPGKWDKLEEEISYRLGEIKKEFGVDLYIKSTKEGA